MAEHGKLVYSVADVAKLLGIHLNGAYELSRMKGFPAMRLGEKRIIIPKEAFHRWLDDRTAAAIAQED